ncbi:MAG: tetratricopeptide repeat protein [Sedimentisphaerales bacterium]|nr:tetratricopeptide repeat protein [Sedimentisphaerales bacterium]
MMVKRIVNVSFVGWILLFSGIELACLADDAATFYETACKHAWAAEREQAKALYQQIINSYPDSEYANKAPLDIGRADILYYIEIRDDYSAQQAIGNLIANYNEHSYLPDALYSVATRCTGYAKYEMAKETYQKITQKRPGSLFAGRARLDITRIKILALIDEGLYSEAEEATKTLKSDFAGHTYLPWALYTIGNRYEVTKAYQQAQGVYQDIIKSHPDSLNATRAQAGLSRIGAYQPIEEEEPVTPGEVIDTLVAGAAESGDIPASIYAAAGRYEQKGKYQQAEDVYQQIAKDYPESPYGNKSRLDSPRMFIFTYIDAEDYAAAQAATSQLIADFNDNSYLPTAELLIAEHYYVKGLFDKALTMLQTVINDPVCPIARPMAYICAGKCYYKLADYEKSTQYYERIVAEYPGHYLAWQVMYLIVQNYQDMYKAGLISKVQADSKIKAVYQQLLKRYPDCKAAKAATHWLNQHNSK